MKLKAIAAVLVVFSAGVICGAFLFSQSLPRTFVSFVGCSENCFRPNDIAGLIASAGIQRASFLVPGVTLESDTCLAIRHPDPRADEKAHYVLFPKHDIKNIGTLSAIDSPYVWGCLVLARELIARDGLYTYHLSTNGPGLQDITYLHFHLVESGEKSSIGVKGPGR